jgi:hypothetical protein
LHYAIRSLHNFLGYEASLPLYLALIELNSDFFCRTHLIVSRE